MEMLEEAFLTIYYAFECSSSTVHYKMTHSKKILREMFKLSWNEMYIRMNVFERRHLCEFVATS